MTQAADSAAAETNKDETIKQNLPAKDLNIKAAFGGVQTHEYPDRISGCREKQIVMDPVDCPE